MKQHISKILCALTIALNLQTAYSAQQYVLVGEKTWDGLHKFTSQVQKRNTRESIGTIEFKADKTPCNYTFKTTQDFPTLDLQNTSSCESFYDRLQQFIATSTIQSCAYRYKGKFPNGTRSIQEKPEHQSPLTCILSSCVLTPNYDTGFLSLTELLIGIGNPDENLPLDITHKVSGWVNLPLSYTQEQGTDDESIVCQKANESGIVVLSSGAIRKYTRPTIQGITNLDYLPSTHKTPHYLPSLSNYKKALFATIFSKHPEPIQEQILELCSDSESENECYSDTSSRTESDYIPPVESSNSVFALDRYYKIIGNPLELTSPYIFLEKGGVAYYTRAFHVPCFEINLESGDIIQEKEYVLQWFQKSAISSGNHSCHTGGYGLRWGIYDEENLPLYPNAFQNQSLDPQLLAQNILTLRQEPNGDRSANYTREEYIIPRNKTGDRWYWNKTRKDDYSNDLKAIFDKQRKEIILKCENGVYDENYWEPVGQCLQDAPIETLKMSVIDPNDSAGYPVFFRSLITLPALKTLHLDLSYNFTSGMLWDAASMPWGQGDPWGGVVKPCLPPTIESLTFNCTSQLHSGFHAVTQMLKKNPLPNLKNLTISSHNANFGTFCSSLLDVIETHPHLEEVNLSVQLQNHPLSHLCGTYDINTVVNGVGIQYGPINYETTCMIHYYENRQLLEIRQWGYNDKIALSVSKSNLRTMTLSTNCPIGVDVIYNYNCGPTRTYSITPTQPCRYWKHFMNMIHNLKNKDGLKVEIH